ncbi:sensor histidine kinase [Oceanibacterium hippocampi]|uniref:histidine kinase n=1 Tax=Oceanibacterium hippocampi TaxID=745714 RepID=A0A1Y5U257_9PROT|nr:PAS domain-containing sensor histidine kinase [Oceanibacterium hippocampi]SLN77164.1 Non-motile and phage-resistance protein [Oceanibacterium hippocampi]
MSRQQNERLASVDERLAGRGRGTDTVMKGVVGNVFFDALFEQAPPTYVARQDGTLIYANSAFRRAFRLPGGSAGGTLPSLPDQHLAIIREVADNGRISARRITHDCGNQRLHFLGRHFPIRDQGEQLLAVGATFIDATREAEVEERLRRERKRFSDVARAASDWIWETDAKLRLTFVSDPVTQALGLPPLLLKGRRLHELGRLPETGHDLENIATSAFRAHSPFRDAPFEIDTPDGTTRNYLLNGVPVFDEEGDFDGYRGTSTDVTARLSAENEANTSKNELEKALEALTNKNLQLELAVKEANSAIRSKSEFLANMSHELRTPLNAVIGFAEVMKLETFGALSDHYRGYVDNILNAGRHLLSLIEDILDIARIENDIVTINVTPIPLSDIIRDARALIELRAGDRGIDIGEVAYDGPMTLRVDGMRTLQIFVNLLGNAVKFTQPGGKVGIDVRLDATRQLADIVVWDNGPGISDEMRETIFDAFRQGQEGVMTSPQEGVGLGLTLSRKLARLMGGDVTLESAGGESCRFVVSLPVGTGED